MRVFTKTSLGTLILAAALSTQLTACVPVIVGGAAVGGSMAADRRTSGTYIEDQAIELKASKAIADSLKEKVHANLTSFNRQLLITGEVSDEANKKKAESLVKPIENVLSIHNYLAIGPNSSLSTRTNDAYITSKVKANFIKENKFSANYVKVVTESGSVYLLGLVTHKEADDAVEIARSIGGVKTVVKVFEYID
ncbi:BON domain-containing protein [Candidatus Methylopumilus turicensis]|uniref:Transport-associated protein n=1 Tax=Candidatus Methylopumilus turicensis TaxID=1581680 RepID=A0A0B7IWA3_9PROT|nr:BON domain-containing protein [Candidatus Methylopumilus turicensis]CEN56587.1 Transport-associated protein [Candidatus Methylopumilus turicensis]